MNSAQRVARNTFLLLAAESIGLGMGFFYIMYSARYLGADNYGILSLALAFTAIMWFFTDIGLSTLILRDVARDKNLSAKYLGNALALKLVLAVFTLILTIIIVRFLVYSREVSIVIYLISISNIINSFSTIFYDNFQAFEKMEFASLSLILTRGLMLPGALIIISINSNVIAFAFLNIIVNIINLCYCFLATNWKFAKPSLDIDLNLCKYMVKEAYPFGVAFLFQQIYSYVATLMLSLLISDPNRIIGWYNASYGLVTIFSIIPTTISAALYPVMSKSYGESSKESLKLMVEKSFKYLMVLAFPLGFGVTILADEIILFIYGSEYSPAAIVLRILIWAEVMLFLSRSFGAFLNSTNKQKVVTKITFFAVFLTVILNLILQLKFSYIGAGIATLITEIFMLLSLFLFIKKSDYRLSKYIIFDLLKILFACIIMSLFIEAFGDLNLIPLILLSAFTYLASVLLLGIADSVDIYMFKQIAGDYLAQLRVR